MKDKELRAVLSRNYVPVFLAPGFWDKEGAALALKEARAAWQLMRKARAEAAAQRRLCVRRVEAFIRALDNADPRKSP